MTQLNFQDDQHREIRNLFDSIKTAIDSTSEQCLKLDLATRGLCMEAIALDMLEIHELNALYPLVESLRVQAIDMEERKVLFNKTLNEAIKTYVALCFGFRRRQAVTHPDSKTEVTA